VDGGLTRDIPALEESGRDAVGLKNRVNSPATSPGV